MVNQNLKNTYEVEVLLSFTCEDKKDVPPYRGSSTVDLNGDDVKDQLYINSDGVYVNGQWKATFKDSAMEYWILDIAITV